MITRTGRTYFLDGKETYINEKLLEELGRKYLTNLMDYEVDNFLDEVIFRIEDLDLDSEIIGNITVEQYYFAACLAYSKDNSIKAFYQEDDDENIFEYCGTTLEEIA